MTGDTSQQQQENRNSLSLSSGYNNDNAVYGSVDRRGSLPESQNEEGDANENDNNNNDQHDDLEVAEEDRVSPKRKAELYTILILGGLIIGCGAFAAIRDIVRKEEGLESSGC